MDGSSRLITDIDLQLKIEYILLNARSVLKQIVSPICFESSVYDDDYPLLRARSASLGSHCKLCIQAI